MLDVHQGLDLNDQHSSRAGSRAKSGKGPAPTDLFALQRMVGNQAVARLLAAERPGLACQRFGSTHPGLVMQPSVQRCPGGCSCGGQSEEVAQRDAANADAGARAVEKIVTDDDIAWLTEQVHNRGSEAEDASSVQALAVQRSWTSCMSDKLNFLAAIAATVAAGAGTIAALLAPEPTTITKWAAVGLIAGIIAGLAWAISAAIAWRNCENQQPNRDQEQIDRLQRQIDQMQRTLDELNRARGQAPAPAP
jgi:hypothetical protein